MAWISFLLIFDRLPEDCGSLPGSAPGMSILSYWYEIWVPGSVDPEALQIDGLARSVRRTTEQSAIPSDLWRRAINSLTWTFYDWRSGIQMGLDNVINDIVDNYWWNCMLTSTFSNNCWHFFIFPGLTPVSEFLMINIHIGSTCI